DTFRCGCRRPRLSGISRPHRHTAGCAEQTLCDVMSMKARRLYLVLRIPARDVLNLTDEVKRKLANRRNVHMGIRYGSTTAQATLGALAGAAATADWSASVAGWLGMGATYIFGLGQIFDSKAHAQAYEQAFTAIQNAESNYYFHRVGLAF